MKTIWLACGVLEAELKKLLADNYIVGELLAFESMLHMRPEAIESTLRHQLTDLPGRFAKVLVYGDCCAGMVDIVKQCGIARVDAINCAQMLLGKEKYREMMRREVFMFLPEWAERWEEVFKQELGLVNSEQARIVIGDNRKEIVFLDTGLSPVPTEKMCACSEFTGLKWYVERVDLQFSLLPMLLTAQQKAVKMIEKDDN